MSERTFLLDSDLLCLLAVGSTGVLIIAKHKKTRKFTRDDFDLLQTILQDGRLLLLPNIVTEASNHLMWHQPPERDRICLTLKRIIEAERDTYVASRTACEQTAYVRLGVADASVLAVSEATTIVTCDAALFLAAEAKGLKVVNFNHERERYGTV